jgi:hypothetical protein
MPPTACYWIQGYREGYHLWILASRLKYADVRHLYKPDQLKSDLEEVCELRSVRARVFLFFLLESVIFLVNKQVTILRISKCQIAGDRKGVRCRYLSSFYKDE